VTPKKEDEQMKKFLILNSWILSLNGWRHFQKLGSFAFRSMKIYLHVKKNISSSKFQFLDSPALYPDPDSAKGPDPNPEYINPD
jgi:hypothetical protein